MMFLQGELTSLLLTFLFEKGQLLLELGDLLVLVALLRTARVLLLKGPRHGGEGLVLPLVEGFPRHA